MKIDHGLPLDRAVSYEVIRRGKLADQDSCPEPAQCIGYARELLAKVGDDLDPESLPARRRQYCNEMATTNPTSHFVSAKWQVRRR
jgi:hypothetical protein